ncbi:MAG: S41 family peptidase [Cytophagales bacterium]|nr:S41 family peptidase [Cytophagales bacterium]
MRNLVLFAWLFGFTQVLAQNLEPSQVNDDLTYLADNIKTYNPALSYYHPEFDHRSNQLISQSAGEERSTLHFFSLVSQLCAMANEGHFVVHDWEDELHQGFGNNTYAYLPIQVKIRAQRLYVYGDFTDEQPFERGDEIIAINGVKTEQILRELVKHVPSDGDILTYAHRKIEDRFSTLYYLYLEQPQTFEITFYDKKGVEQIVSCAALVREALVTNLRKYYPSEPGNTATNEQGFYDLDYHAQYAYLKLPSFDFRRVNKYRVKSKKMYKTIFEELQNKEIKHLVIDLRNNTGGRNEFADDMIPFISKSSINDPFVKKTISWDQQEKTYKKPNPSKLAFKGEIYVLINGKTYSAGNTLARYLKEYGNANMIGEETGTRYEGFAAGSTQEIILPHSNLKIGIPRYLISFPASAKQKTSNRGLLPDHEIENALEVPVAGPDAYLRKAIELITESDFN